MQREGNHIVHDRINDLNCAQAYLTNCSINLPACEMYSSHLFLFCCKLKPDSGIDLALDIETDCDIFIDMGCTNPLRKNTVDIGLTTYQ